MMITKSVLWNLVCFNIAWLGLVFIGNPFIPVAIFLFGTQLWFFSTEKSDFALIFMVAVIGITLDFSLVYTGVFTFPDTEYIPFWLITLWFCFASTIRLSLDFLAKSIWLQFFMGTCFAPLSYIAGAKANVVYLSPSISMSYLLLAVLWGPLMLVFFALSRWLKIESPDHVS